MDCNGLPSNTDFVQLDAALGENFAGRPLPLVLSTGITARRIKLTWGASRYDASSTTGIRVRVEASGAVGMPNKIFAYLLQPLKPGDTERVGAFDHVCSPSDLEDYPENAPIPGYKPEWFRLDYVDLVLRARTEVYEFIKDLAADVHMLKTTLDTADRIFPAGEVWIGGAPAQSSSSSALASSSSSSSSSARNSSSSSSSSSR
jgi:hypothetical protein